MASKKKLLQAAAGSAGGGEVLDIPNVFNTFLYDGTGSSQNINNGINLGNNIAGSVDFDGSGDSLESSSHSFAYGTGDFTVEFWVYFDSVSGTINVFDNRSSSSTGFMIGKNNDTKLRFYWNGADRIVDSATISTGQWYHIAAARSSGTIKMFKNGTQIGSDYTSTPDLTSNLLELGQRSYSDGLAFDGRLSNVRVVIGTAVYTSNFTTPTEPLTAISGTELLICTANNFQDEGPNNIAFTVKGDPQVLSSSPFTGNTGKGGLVWIKRRDATENHNLYDTERGVTKDLRANATTAEGTEVNGLQAFNSNGFTVGGDGLVGVNGGEYVSWTWRKAPKFFNVVTYTGNTVGNSAQTISHGLGSTPGFIIVKRYSTADNWIVWHRSITNGFAALNDTGAWLTSNYTSFISSVGSTSFTVGESLNTNGASFVAYVFAHNDGDGEFGPDADQDIIKCGSYSGNGSSTYGTFQNLGFEPQWIILKETTITEPWVMLDNMRGVSGLGSNDPRLQANNSVGEAGGEIMQFNATGFTPLTADDKVNGSGKSYIYMAIRRGPLAQPEDATKVFEVFNTTNTGGASTIGSIGPSDLMLNKRTDGAQTWRLLDRLHDGKMLRTDSNDTQSSAGFVEWDTMKGVNVTSSGAPYITNDSQTHWSWRRAPGYFDVVAYTGTGASPRNVSHNLGVVPEMMWIKRRTAGNADWAVYHSALGNTKQIGLNDDSAASTVSYWNNTTPTAAHFTLNDSNIVNGASSSYIYSAYLFATLAGVSKVGSYSGNGSSQNIDCGFSSGARFVLIKRYDTAEGWKVHDSVRGIVAGNDPFVELDKSNATNSSFDLVDPYSGGFAVNNYAGWNASGGSYIFYAIA